MSEENKKIIEEGIKLTSQNEFTTFTPKFFIDALINNEKLNGNQFGIMLLGLRNKMLAEERGWEEKKFFHTQEEITDLYNKNMIEFVNGFIVAVLDPDDWEV